MPLWDGGDVLKQLCRHKGKTILIIHYERNHTKSPGARTTISGSQIYLNIIN
jgi:hypothetical protein